MWKILGLMLIFCGVAGLLYCWVAEQKKRQRILQEFIIFLEKSIRTMEMDKMKVITHFERYVSQQLNDAGKEIQMLGDVLREIATRLSTNTYPSGQAVWEEVFREAEQSMAFDKETFSIILQAGNGFFGRSRDENIRFLEKSIGELEERQKIMKIKDAQERKVWVPVGMLGAVMLGIILI